MNQFPTIYYDPISEPSKAVYWWAKNAGVKVNIKLTWLGKLQQATSEYAKMNPMKQVPVLKHNNFILSESSAIIAYLAETAKVKDKWFGSNVIERAYVNQYLSWYHTNLRQKFTLDYYLKLIIKPCFENQPKTPSNVLDETIAKNTIIFEYMDKALENKKYFLGDKLTIVDFVFASELYTLLVNKRINDLIESHKNIKKWLQNMKNVPYYQEVHETEIKYFHPCMQEYLVNDDPKKCFQKYAEMMEVEEKRLLSLEDFI